MSDKEIMKNCPAPQLDDFDLMVEDLAGELVPERRIAESVTPWKNALRKVVAGLALTILQINNANLDLLLPLIGMVLLLVGSRALRNANGAFRMLYHTAIVMAVLRGFLLVSAASCLWVAARTEVLSNVLGVIGLLLNLWLLIGFRTGLANAMEKAGAEPKTGWATAAVLWYLAVLVLSLTGIADVLVWLIIAVYVLIISALIVQAGKLDMAGYALEPSVSKLSDLAFGGLYVGIVALGIVICGLFFSRLPMQWQVRGDECINTQTARQAQQQLLELGVPEEIVNVLGEEDLSLLWGADRVLVQELPENASNDPSLRGLLITHVAVRVPQKNDHEKYKWRFIHYFVWPDKARFGGIETIKMDALYSVTNDQGQMIDNTASEISGRVLMDKDGIVYEAPYYGHSLNGDASEWGVDFRIDRTIFATKFSFPRTAENARGYLMYAALFNIDNITFCSRMDYWHTGGFLYPYADPSLQNQRIVPLGSYMTRSENTRFETSD